MTDFFIKLIPIPLPRPEMEEIIPGAKNAGIKLDIPFPDMANIDLTFPLVGSNYWLSLWTGFKDLFNFEEKQGWVEFQINSYEEVVVFFGVLIAVGFFSGLLEIGLRKISTRYF